MFKLIIEDIYQLEENENVKDVGEIEVIEVLQHISHTDLVDVLEKLYSKLKPEGKLYIKVPDMEWISRQIIRFESGQILSGKYADFEGKYGLQALVYGAYPDIKDERVQSCFTRASLWELLDGVGYKKIKIEQAEEEIGILNAHCIKLK